MGGDGLRQASLSPSKRRFIPRRALADAMAKDPWLDDHDRELQERIPGYVLAGYGTVTQRDRVFEHGIFFQPATSSDALTRGWQDPSK